MPVTVTIDHAAGFAADLPEGALVALGVRAGRFDDDAPHLDAALAEAAGFTAQPAQTFVAPGAEGPTLYVGLGDAPTADAMRRIGAAAARAAKAEVLLADLLGPFEGPERVAAADALTQGLALGTYRFTTYKADSDAPTLGAITVVGKGGKRMADAVDRGRTVADAIAFVRDLANTPGGDLTPKAFAARATDAAEQAGLEIEVWDKAAIRKAKLGGLLGVARGSKQDPRFLVVRSRPAGAPRGKVALVGKGVTFDSGGLSIKTSTGMMGMKGDMAGAAAVLGAMTLVPRFAPRVEVTAYLPITDNMLGGDATRVGDVLRARNGTTIEVLNTDAEGRLILADALSLAVEDEPDAIVDLATLTGACMVALGDRTAGVMGNHDALRQRVLDAADAAGERAWPLPLPDHLRKGLDSEVADLKNIGANGYGGALTAGIFLREFVGDVPWVHLDIAGPADASAAYDEFTKGATGFGVRTLLALLATWSKLPPEAA